MTQIQTEILLVFLFLCYVAPWLWRAFIGAEDIYEKVEARRFPGRSWQEIKSARRLQEAKRNSKSTTDRAFKAKHPILFRLFYLSGD